MPEFLIQQVLRGRYGESNQLRRVAVIAAPNANQALRKFADWRQAIIRIGERYDTHNEWVATILMADRKTLRDFIATPN